MSKELGIDLENIVYFKDEMHYFVMTAKKQSLLKRGVLKEVRFIAIMSTISVYSASGLNWYLVRQKLVLHNNYRAILKFGKL